MYDVHCTYMFCTDCSGRGHWCSVVHLFCRLHNPTLSKIEVTTTRPVQWGDLGTLLEIQCYDFAVCWLGWPLVIDQGNPIQMFARSWFVMPFDILERSMGKIWCQPRDKHFFSCRSLFVNVSLYTFKKLLIVDYCWCHQNSCFEMQSACIDKIYSIVSCCEFCLENSSKLCYVGHL